MFYHTSFFSLGKLLIVCRLLLSGPNDSNLLLVASTCLCRMFANEDISRFGVGVGGGGGNINTNDSDLTCCHG